MVLGTRDLIELCGDVTGGVMVLAVNARRTKRIAQNQKIGALETRGQEREELKKIVEYIGRQDLTTMTIPMAL